MNGQTVLLTYSAAGASKIRDLANPANNAAPFSGYPVTNNVLPSLDFPSAGLLAYYEGDAVAFMSGPQYDPLDIGAAVDKSANARNLSATSPNYPLQLVEDAKNGRDGFRSKLTTYNGNPGYGGLQTAGDLPNLDSATIYVVFNQTAADALIASGFTQLLGVGFGTEVNIGRIVPIANQAIQVEAMGSERISLPVTDGQFVSLRVRIGGGIVRACINNGVEGNASLMANSNPGKLTMLGDGEKTVLCVLIYGVNHDQATRDAIELTLKNRFTLY